LSIISTLQRCASGGVARRSLAVAVIVGTILNLINQSDAIFGQGHLDIARMLLNYVVPFGVATYGAVSLRRGLTDMADACRSRHEMEREGDRHATH